ncbi:hypothetical protein TARUN_7564 [Trichoderma arundinaceum]|uniref:Uncharacterized protein n=1 Tax=Trichoderma arundinaceum TaxID=490622 RepID=A0A395NFF9_TRIAR|nr:hypothetical protein TARUN_7564 [Trichoderma arundinaceum]
MGVRVQTRRSVRPLLLRARESALEFGRGLMARVQQSSPGVVCDLLPCGPRGQDGIPRDVRIWSIVTFSFGIPSSAGNADAIFCRNSSWANWFTAQRPPTVLRAWCRVPVAAGPSTLRKGMTIMKRIGRSVNSPVARPQPKMAVVEVVEAIPEDLEETRRANRRRLDSFVPPAEDARLELVGEPLSRAEVLNTIIRAKVAVANCYLHEEYTDVSDQRSLAKKSTYSKMIVPMKRRFHDYSTIDFEYARGGNGAAIYSELDPIISKALQTGVTEIDVNMASITEAAVNLQSTRRNPRILLAASGMPDLSDIADVTEPPSTLTLEPNDSMTDAKSPTKRDSTQSPSPTKSNKSFRKRLSDTIVRLLPVSSSRAEPSPIKPPSPPPSKDSTNAGGRRSSITIPKSPNAAQSPLSANSTPGLVRWSNRPSKDSPFARWRPMRKSEPVTRLLADPSSPRNESASTVDVTMGEASFAPESPVRQSRPLAPTPNKWNGLQPSTPGQKPLSTVATPGDDKSSLELVKSLPEWMQHSQSPATLEKCDPSNINFGPASPSFTNSVSWMNSPVDATESERTKIVRRRKSEPLFRNMLRTQNSRRTSLSPQKSIRTDGTSGAMPTIDEPASPIEDLSRIAEHADASEFFNSATTRVNDVAQQAGAMEQTTSSSQYNKKLQEASSNSSPATRNCSSTSSIFNVDMHRDQDIFGASSQAAAPASSAVEQLAQMAETGCGGHANVVIAKKNGRLVVRFKLPVAYASMFPESQGADESHFSSSPSAISSSPRVRFPTAASLEDAEELSILENEESYLRTSDETLVVSDFGSSPVKRSASSSSHQGSVSSSPASSSQNINNVSISFPDITYAPDGETTIPVGVDSSPVKASKSVIKSDSSSLSDLGHTPSLDKSAELSIANGAVTSEEEAAPPAQSVKQTPTTTANPPGTSPTLSLSFTPVNQASARKSATPSSTRSSKSASNASPEFGKLYPIPSISHNDTPERDFLREFIRRSKPRRASTTETGSPIAPQQRLPLGARSPNMETQQKEKRKFDSSEGEENESETKTEPAAKRVRRVSRGTPRKPVAGDHSDDEDPLAMDVPATSTKASDNSDELANAEEQEDTPAVARRSSRLKTRPDVVPKSSIPGPTKVGRARSAIGSTLGSVRSEQQDLVHQTRVNTRRNKGNAEYPAQFLARHSEEEEADEEMLDQEETESAKARRGKSVIWKEPLADYQEEAKPKRGRPAAAAPKAKELKMKAKPVGVGRVTKPAPKVTTSTQKQRSTRLAAGLGMAGNGTPAAKRVTRASARTRK